MAHGVFNTASGAIPFVGPPGIPSNLIAVAVGQNRIDLTWTLSTAKPTEKGVRVYRSTDGGPFVAMADLPSRSITYSDTELLPGTTYSYYVVSLGRLIPSLPSNTVSTTTAGENAPVAHFTAETTTVTAGSSILFTNTSTGTYTASSWKVNGVEVSTLDSPSIPFDTPGTFGVTLTVTGPGGSDTTSPATNISVTAVSTPNLLSAVVSPNGTRWTLTFDATVTGHSGFVFRDGAGNTLSASYVSGETTTALLFDVALVYSGDTPHLDYTPGDVNHSSTPLAAFTGFVVTNDSDQSVPVGDSPSISAVGVTGDVLTVTFAAAVSGYANVDRAFLNDFGEHGFVITSGSGGLRVHEYTAGDGTTSLTFKLNRTPTAGESLTLAYVPGYLVAASGGAPLRPLTGRSVTNNNSGVSDPATPGVPATLTATAADDWTVVLGCTLPDSRGTQVEWQRSAAGAGSWVTVLLAAGGTNAMNDEGPLSPSTAYDYRVRAGNVSGWSNWSATATATTLAGSTGWIMDPTTNPTFVSGDISGSFTATTTSDSTVRLNWTTPRLAAAGLLHVYRSDAGGPFRRIQCVSLVVGSQSWNDAGLAKNTQYTYRAALVLASAAYGPWAEAAATTSNTSGVPLVPADLSHFVASEAQSVVMWRDTNGGAASYLIETAPIPSTWVPDVATWTQVGQTAVGETAFTLTTTAKQTRYVRVRADLSGAKGGYTPFDVNRTVVRPPSGASGTISVTPSTFATLAPQMLTAKRVEFADGTYPYKPYFVSRGRANDPVVYTKAAGATSVVFDVDGAVNPAAFDPPGGYVYQDFIGGYVGKLVSDPQNGYQPGHLKVSGVTIRHASRDNLSVGVVAKSLTANTATVTTSAPHGVVVGGTCYVEIGDSLFDGNKAETGAAGIQTNEIIAVTSTTISWRKVASDVPEAACTGTVRYSVYTADDGTSRNFSTAGSGLYLQSGDHVVIDGCTLADNGNGMFGANNGSENRDLARIVVRGNTFSGNGTYKSDKQHITYLECRGVVYEANDYLPSRTLSAGAGLKDRSTDVTIRCNNMACSTVRYFDLVECQNQQARALADPAWGRVHAWGNRMLNAVVGSATGATTPINWGQDDGQDKNGRRHLLRFYHNSLVNRFESGQKFRIIWFKTASRAEAVWAINNVFSTASPTGGTKPEPDLFSTAVGVGVFGGNFLSTGYKQQSGSSADTAMAYGVGGSVSPSDNKADFIDAPNGDVRILEGTASAGVGVDLPLDFPLPNQQYVSVGVLEDRTNYGAGGDLGYTDAEPDTTAPTVSGAVTVNELGNQVTVPLSEACVGGTGFVLTVNASPVSLTKNTGASTSTSFVYDIASVVLTGQTCSLAKSGGDIADVAGNAMADFSGRSVTNTSLIASEDIPAAASSSSGTRPNGTTATWAAPAGTTVGDALLAVVTNVTAGAGGTTTEPAGHWTKLIDVADGFSACRLTIWRRIADGTSSDDITLQSTAAKTWAGGIIRFIGADPVNPFTVFGSSTQTTGSTPTCPDETTPVDNCGVVSVLATDGTFTAPGSPNVSVWGIGGSAATAASGVVYRGQVTAGATGTTAFGFAGNNQAVTATVVVNPAP